MGRGRKKVEVGIAMGTLESRVQVRAGMRGSYL